MEEQDYKIFVGGLTVNTVETDLEEYFSAFGQVSQVAIIRNKQTGLSKCYAFIHTDEARTYQRILSQKHHIQGRMIDCKDGFSKDQNPQLFEKMNNKKFFVGGLSFSTKDQNLYQHFSKFGPVFKAYVIIDPKTQVSKRFGFVIMENQESVDKVMKAKRHIVNNQVINCKRFDRQLVENRTDHEIVKSPTKTLPVISGSKVAQLMTEQSESTVFNRLAQLWSFTSQASKMKFNFKQSIQPIDIETASFYQIDNYRGLGSKPDENSLMDQYRLNFCMRQKIYQTTEDRYTRVMQSVNCYHYCNGIIEEPQASENEAQVDEEQVKSLQVNLRK
jgi:RNA recognition motif-containing protein